jgi:hypothetical protein
MEPMVVGQPHGKGRGPERGDTDLDDFDEPEEAEDGDELLRDFGTTAS